MLKSLELNGFKSFGKKTALVFETPVTAIVGPNGSGKSNVVESIRFVLGEQSMKSMRGKGSSDLIFKGSKSMASQSRARVTITFDNRKKVFSFTGSDNQSANLDFDDVSFAREVGSDGGSSYFINGTEVRLKDVNEALASVNIGSSGHHIISQGEADRILSTSPKERRAMIEDALGLKIYQYKIRESERKLLKTTENMKEAESLRREIAPHLGFLKKQVEKIEKARDMRVELEELYKTYAGSERGYLVQAHEALAEKQKANDEELAELASKLSSTERADTDDSNVREKREALREKQETLAHIRREYEELTRKLGRIEGSLETLLQLHNKPHQEEKRSVSYEELSLVTQSVISDIDALLEGGAQESMESVLRRIKEQLGSLLSLPKTAGEDTSSAIPTKEIVSLENTKSELAKELASMIEKENEGKREVEMIERALQSMDTEKRETDRMFYELSGKRTEAEGVRNLLALEHARLGDEETRFSEEMKEAEVLLGMTLDHIVPVREPHVLTSETRSLQEINRKKIERIKIKLEDIGGGSGSDVLKEYDDTLARDQFLSRELEDIRKSIESLRSLISELKDTLDTKFKEGIEKINHQFQEFFKLMFGGGTAFLSIVVEHRRARAEGELEDEIADPDEDELEFERGIDINVSLPQKKVKDLHMLSGGERSLTSIALLFAMSQVNPPPFLVLDETDAALDEANSRKYGDMLENLSKYSQLIVVTHNRETMSRAQVLYGVTVGADGASKLLSIKLDEAVQIAK